MKKIIAVITVTAVLIVAMASFAYAADGAETPQWFEDMISWKKDQVDQAVKDGNLTEDQAEVWNEHFEDMEEWHEESGFGPGGCHGGFGGPGLRGQGFRGGYGGGMMRGYNSWNQSL